jgi:DNA polymerase-3 subunit alpha
MLNAYEEVMTPGEEETVRHYTEISDGQAVTMGGMVSAFKKLQTRGGTYMAFVTVEDLYGSVECVCFPKVYDRIRNFLEIDKVVSIKGKISIPVDKAPSIIVESMEEFDPEAQEKPVVENTQKEAKVNTKQRLWLNVTGMEEEDVDELLDTLSSYAGDTEVVFV